ncbi:MAG: aldo/keto reductase, partial [Alphaproteobacteria bacterium HGW-Alphaproteobacteria-5]
GIPADSRVMLPGYEWLRDELASSVGQDRLAKVARLAALSRDAGMPINHLALLWCLANPRVSTVILGASRVAQLADNLAALKNREKMTPNLREAIEAIVQNRPEGPRRF